MELSGSGAHSKGPFQELKPEILGIREIFQWQNPVLSSFLLSYLPAFSLHSQLLIAWFSWIGAKETKSNISGVSVFVF